MKVRVASFLDSPSRGWLKAYPFPRLCDDELGTKELLLFNLARMCHHLPQPTVWILNRCGSRAFTSMPRCYLLSSRHHATVIIVFRVASFLTSPPFSNVNPTSFLPRSFQMKRTHRSIQFNRLFFTLNFFLQGPKRSHLALPFFLLPLSSFAKPRYTRWTGLRRSAGEYSCRDLAGS